MEKQHEKFFREFRDKFHDIYSKMPWGGGVMGTSTGAYLLSFLHKWKRKPGF